VYLRVFVCVCVCVCVREREREALGRSSYRIVQCVRHFVGAGNPTSPPPAEERWGVLPRGAKAPRGSTPRQTRWSPPVAWSNPNPIGKRREPAPGGTRRKSPGVLPKSQPLWERREAHPGARGAGARAGDSPPGNTEEGVAWRRCPSAPQLEQIPPRKWRCGRAPTRHIIMLEGVRPRG